jgi:enoyl-CoA hydratase/carnithine racemase
MPPTATVRVDQRPPVATVFLSRPEVRNAVDLATTKALANAFRAFDTDDLLLGVSVDRERADAGQRFVFSQNGQ